MRPSALFVVEKIDLRTKEIAFLSECLQDVPIWHYIYYGSEIDFKFFKSTTSELSFLFWLIPSCIQNN